MEIFKLNKAIENEKLDLEMAMVQLKEAKENLSQSLKRRKELANQMNDLRYVEERIEDFFPPSSSNEANNAIKELLEKNGSLQEEVRKLKREQEIQSIRLCEILEQRNKAQEDLEARNNEQQNQSNQNEDLTDQITEANEEITILKAQNERIRNYLNHEKEISEIILRELRSEKKINEKLKNDLKDEKLINERMIKSQEDVNQLNQQNEKKFHKQEGK